VWKPSQSNSNASIFTHAMFHATYCAPGGFNWDYGDDPVNDDPRLENVNVKSVADSMAKCVHLLSFRSSLPLSLSLSHISLCRDIQERTKGYRTDQILWAFGCDFQYSNPRLNFKSMNKLFRYINARQDQYGFKLVYSTPSRYYKAVQGAGVKDWEVKTDDIFPYADGPDSYWTG
jgi:hypothetical protein